MGAEQKTHFLLDKNKCTKCGRCINTCSGMVLASRPDGYPEMGCYMEHTVIDDFFSIQYQSCFSFLSSETMDSISSFVRAKSKIEIFSRI